jgi:hypothetical protein
MVTFGSLSGATDFFLLFSSSFNIQALFSPDIGEEIAFPNRGYHPTLLLVKTGFLFQFAIG